MFLKKLFVLIWLFGGIIAQTAVEALPNGESNNIRGNQPQQTAVDHEKILAEISNLTATQNQILEKLSKLEQQLAQNSIQNLQTTQPPEVKIPIAVMTNHYTEPLRFHPRCGKYAEVTNDGHTARRLDDENVYNYATVLTQRPLRSNELFEVRVERLQPRWYGSLQIGVTVHSAKAMEFPSDMYYVRTGTWLMNSDQVFHNGENIFKAYGENLINLEVGDRVGVMLKDDSTLHYYVNGVDQGEAARDVPVDVYGFVDVFARVAEVSIVNTLQ